MRPLAPLFLALALVAAACGEDPQGQFPPDLTRLDLVTAGDEAAPADLAAAPGDAAAPEDLSAAVDMAGSSSPDLVAYTFYFQCTSPANACPTTPPIPGTKKAGEACTMATECIGGCCTCKSGKPWCYAQACSGGKCTDAVTACAIFADKTPEPATCQ